MEALFSCLELKSRSSKQAIVEESTPEETQGGRARRAVDGQGGFAIGVRKEKRVIEPYKYWRVDNKDKNKKRKMMAGKLWKGRKRPKLESLTPDEEVGIHFTLKMVLLNWLWVNDAGQLYLYPVCEGISE